MPERSFRANRAALSRRRPVAAAVASFFVLAVAPASALATTWKVDSCDEGNSGDILSQTGTLRFAAAHAAPTGDTIDMTGLTCGTISLTTGTITLNQDDITITGPTDVPLTITGTLNTAAALLTHNGYGTLTLQHLDLEYANNTRAFGYVHGGCVYSYGSVVLEHVNARHCDAVTAGGNAVGGAIFAHQDLSMKFSTVTFSQARGTMGARAGGVYARNHLLAEYSAIDHNAVYDSEAGFGGAGGGMFAGGITLKRSTVSNNYSHGDGGGFAVVRTGASGDYLRMYSSTVSGNYAAHRIGGGYASVPTVAVYNSTIAFNSALLGNRFLAPGLALSSYFTPMTATLQSSLLSDNTVIVPDPNGDGSTEYDLSTILGGTQQQPNLVTFNAAPANNFIRRTMADGVPSDTLAGSCPLLGPLRDNGGRTQTHALLSGSAAIDAGNNALNVTEDQRGLPGDTGPPFPYTRMSNGVSDIGAYELQQDDVIFAASVEACVPIPI